jgi:hypothetical protein
MAFVAGLGAAVGYFFDKDQGQVRRAELQAKIKSFADAGNRGRTATADGSSRPDPDLFPSPSAATTAAGYVAPQPSPGEPDGDDPSRSSSSDVAPNQGDVLSPTPPNRRS